MSESLFSHNDRFTIVNLDIKAGDLITRDLVKEYVEAARALGQRLHEDAHGDAAGYRMEGLVIKMLPDRFAGAPLKAIALTHAGRTVRGEAMIDRDGVEGGAVYALSAALRDAIEREEPDPQREQVVLLERRDQELVMRGAVHGPVDSRVEGHQGAVVGDWSPDGQTIATGSQNGFVKIWSAATVSVVGSQVTLIAVPFIAVTMLGAGVFQVSLLTAVEMLPFLLFTLPAGAWLDRIRRRPVLIAADLGRGLVLLSIPVAYVAGALTLGQLYVVAFITGTLTAFFDIADQSYLPAILDRDDIVDGNAHLQISYSIAQIGGPTLCGKLIAMVAAPFAIAVDALSFFVSGGFISAIRRREEAPKRRLDESGRPASMRSEIAEGLRYVLGNRYLRPIAACTATSNLFAAALFGVFPVLIWQELMLPPAFYGTVVGLASIGFLAGAALSNRPRFFMFPQSRHCLALPAAK